jgi:predicted esterase
MTVCFLLLSIGHAAAQEESAPQTLGMGDEVTGELEQGERRRYILAIAETDKPADVVLYSTGDSVLYVYDEEAHSQWVDRIGDYGHEVFTIEAGDTSPAEIEVGFYLDGVAGDYVLSVLPTDPQVSEALRPGEQVKRWAELEVGEAGSTETVTLAYLLYVPEDYDEDEQYPFILFMHGAGEAGTRLDFLKVEVIPKLIEDGEDYPFIIASPQLPYGEDWAGKKDVLASFITQLQTELPIDSDRIYVTGLSLGGAGVWNFALAYPDVPAAVVSMAGFYYYGADIVPRNICDLAAVPMWVFHGEQDEIVSIEWEQALVDALDECGGDVQFTIYPDADHAQTFEQGFADPALYTWLLEQHR